ncbi:isoafricanol synthase [Streptomyces barringtoniae]|uniref:isoafricanol synthase n=1 Tax=Streptomyces barringtoniae TaxID=2892029 RepID=UPI0024BF6BCD|nr:isoafricanol synthase [Streptomyces barringtoniae]
MTASGRDLAPHDPTRRAAAVRIPFPARLSPHAERARRHSLLWVQEMGLLTDAATGEYDTLRLERLMAYFYPDAGGRDLELAADFNAWFFIFDDQFDGRLGKRPEAVEALVESLVRTMSADAPRWAPGPADPPLVRAFHDIWHRATADAPDDWRRRFRRHWSAYLTSHQEEARNRTGDRLTSLEQYLATRRNSIGVQPCLDFTERCGAYSLPNSLHDSAPLREMREITGDVVIFVNDIVSLVKEMAVGDVNNSVLVTREEKGCGLDESVAYVAGLANARTARFGQLAAALPASLAARGMSAEARRYVDHYVEGMGHLMAGNLAWSLATSRYDQRGITAVSDGRQRPWASLAAASADPDVRQSPQRAVGPTAGRFGADKSPRGQLAGS